MAYLEMSRDQTHGGGSWGFKSCVWAPEKKKNGHRWPFWSKIGMVRQGDVVVHLKGNSRTAAFVGYSVASGDGILTDERPPMPGAWGWATKFYRADLSDFVAFHKPVNLKSLFRARHTELQRYRQQNKMHGSVQRSVFYTWQSGRWQCTNGAYFSELDSKLLVTLFGDCDLAGATASGDTLVSVQTASQIRNAQVRIGQTEFSQRIRDNYSNTCCFPNCSEADSRFLVASHIARWADNEKLRGCLGNGLCLCIAHDKAFELGVFTLDVEYRVYVAPGERSAQSEFVASVIRNAGCQIRIGQSKPLEIALREHWNRVNLRPRLEG